MVESFKATIYLGGIICHTAAELIQKLGELKDEEVSWIWLWFGCKYIGVSALVSEWSELVKDNRFKELSQLVEVKIIHERNFNTDAASKLKTEILKAIGEGLKLKAVQSEYSNSSMTDEEVSEAIVEDLVFFLASSVSNSVKKLDVRLEENNENSIVFNNNKVKVSVGNPRHFLGILAQKIVSAGKIDEMNIAVKEELREVVDEFIMLITNNIRLLDFKVRIDGKLLEVPERLKIQIRENILEKMAMWIRTGTLVQYGRMKVMMIGRGQAGKSSTVRSLLYQPFDKNIASTIMAEADKDVSIDVQDVTAAWKATKAKEKWVSEELGEYMGKLKQNLETGKRTVVVPETSLEQSAFSGEPIVQNITRVVAGQFSQPGKIGKKNSLVRKYNNRRLRRNKYRYKEEQLSSRNNARLTIWDFGGQEVFYSFHHIYLTTGGLYLLVFNLKLLNKQMKTDLSQIQFWLESVALHAPGASVILVGTRCHKLSKQVLKKIDLKLRGLVESKNIELLTSNELVYFPIDNAKPTLIQKQIEPLRAKILFCLTRETLGDILETNLWHKKISLSWIYFMNHLLKRFKGAISGNQLFQTARELGLNNNRDIIPMLEFYKNAGGIIPFMKEESPESWKFDFVVLSPEWLLQVIGSFIYDEELHKRNKVFSKNGQIQSLMLNYEKTGILSRRLLILILRKANVSASDTDFIINMSKEMLLLSELDFNPEWSTVDGDSFYMVPAMNRQVADEVEIVKEASPDDCFNFYIYCQKYIPIGLFERIICIMLSLNSNFGGATLEPVIKKNFACFIFREVKIYIQNKRENREFRIAISKEEVEEANVLVNAFDIIEKCLETVRTDVLGKEMNLRLQLETSNGEKIRCFWRDLKASIENKKSTKVRVILSDGRKKMRKHSLFDPYHEVAALINQRRKEALQLEKERNELKWEYDVFLAHTWGPNNVTHNQVVQIAKLLEERNFKVWLDEANLKYFVSNDIVHGLKTSSCILVFITELYLEKVENVDTNASREFEQAVKKGTEYMVPIVLDSKCLDQRSWFGSKVGYNFSDALYFDFSSEEKVKANLGRLCERLEEMSRAERPRTAFD